MIMAVQIIFPVILQTVIKAIMLSIGGQGATSLFSNSVSAVISLANLTKENMYWYPPLSAHVMSCTLLLFEIS